MPCVRPWPAAIRSSSRRPESVFPYSYLAPESYVDTNVTGTLNVVQAATDLGVARVVHTSTSEVYGTAQYVPIDEAHPLNPQSPYAAHEGRRGPDRAELRTLLRDPVPVVRPFNTYGPRQSARAVIPTIITQLAAHDPRQGPATIRLGAIALTRDFTFGRHRGRVHRRGTRTDGAEVKL